MRDKVFISDIFSSAVAATKLCPAEAVAAMLAIPRISPARINELWEKHQNQAFVGQWPSDFGRWQSILADALGETPDDGLVARAVGMEMKTLIDCCPPLPDLYGVFEKIAERFRLCLWTNVSPLQLSYLKMLGILDLASGAIEVSCTICQLKADEAVLLSIAADMDCDPSECVVYDDNPENLEIARNLGMTTVLAIRGETIDRLTAADANSFDYVAKRPYDLIEILAGRN